MAETREVGFEYDGRDFVANFLTYDTEDGPVKRMEVFLFSEGGEVYYGSEYGEPEVSDHELIDAWKAETFGMYNEGDCLDDCLDDCPDDCMSDVEADANTLASAGWGTDEDYGYYGDDY